MRGLNRGEGASGHRTGSTTLIQNIATTNGGFVPLVGGVGGLVREPPACDAVLRASGRDVAMHPGTAVRAADAALEPVAHRGAAFTVAVTLHAGGMVSSVELYIYTCRRAFSQSAHASALRIIFAVHAGG